MAASLTTSLAKLSSVSVISPETTAESVRNTKDAAKLARDLGANLFVQGSLQQVGDRLRVSTQLVRPDGTIAWAGDVEAGQLQLFSIQRRIADDVIGAIRVAATASERTRLARPSTTDGAAQDLYLAWTRVPGTERSGQRRSCD